MQFRQKQEGAVLLVSLILLLITTFVGFSSMETSTLENKMATSRQIKEQTFQTAEMAIEETLDDDARIGAALTLGLTSGGWTDWNAHAWKNNTVMNDLSANTRIRYLQSAITEGYTIVKGAHGVKTSYYIVQSQATRTDTNITSTHVQGIYSEGAQG